jgi:hypothetical protein
MIRFVPFAQCNGRDKVLNVIALGFFVVAGAALVLPADRPGRSHR